MTRSSANFLSPNGQGSTTCQTKYLRPIFTTAQLDQRNLTDENAELGVDYKYGLIDPVCLWQKKW